MHLRVLGCSGGIGGQQNRTTSFLVDHDVVLDVGTLREATHARIVRSLVRLAQDMEFRVAAGGVEDAETARALGTLGCGRIQGSFVSPPHMPRKVLEKFASAK